MKINAINAYNQNNNNNKASFKKTAVPYPEYEYAYYQQQTDIISYIADKLSKLFNPKVDKEAQMIKENIDSLCDNVPTIAIIA